MLSSECWTYSEAACPSTCDFVDGDCLPRDWQDLRSTAHSYVASKLVMLSDYTECRGLDEDDCDDKYLQCSYQQYADGTFYEDASCQVQVFTGATSLIRAGVSEASVAGSWIGSMHDYQICQVFTEAECTAVGHANTDTKQCYWDGWGCSSKEAYFIAKFAEACPSEDFSARAKALGFANMESLFDDVGLTPSGYGFTVVSAANQTVCFHVLPFFVFLVSLFVLSFQH